MKQTEKGNKVVHEFTTLAKDERGNQYKVFLTQGEKPRNDSYNGLILSIEETPGAWYLSSLFDNRYNKMPYENSIMPIHGKDWNCINWIEVRKELAEWILDKMAKYYITIKHFPELAH